MEQKKVYQNTKAGKLSVEILFKDGNVDRVLMEQAIPQEIGEIKDLKPLLKCFNIEENT